MFSQVLLSQQHLNEFNLKETDYILMFTFGQNGV